MSDEPRSTIEDFKPKDFWEIDNALWARRVHEHQLIGTRLGWLMSSNAFLLMPVALLYVNDSGGWGERFLIMEILCLLGGLLSAITIWNVQLAIYTISFIRLRQEKLREDVNCPTSLHAIDPDCEFQGPARYRGTHNSSVQLHVVIPVLLLFVWIAVFTTIRNSNCDTTAGFVSLLSVIIYIVFFALLGTAAFCVWKYKGWQWFMPWNWFVAIESNEQ